MQITTIFAELLRFNAGYLAKTLAGIPNEHYFIRPERRGNPLIWLLGHIILSRGEIIEILGGNPGTGNLADLFARGTVPENDPSIYPKPGEFVARLGKLSSVTDHLLKNCDPAVLDRPSWGRFETVGQNLAYSYMHETHHIGQVTYVVNLPNIKASRKAHTNFRKPEKKNSTARILIDNLKSVFS